MIGLAALTGVSPRLYLAAFVVLALGMGAVGTYSKGYQAGKSSADARLAAIELEAAQSRAQALERVLDAQSHAERIERAATARVASARAAAATATTTIVEVIRENPQFADLRRPADLDRVRDAQLDAIAAAAHRAPELPGDRLSSVPVAGASD
jgi:hypothetical protein